MEDCFGQFLSVKLISMNWESILNFQLWGNSGKGFAVALGIFFGLTLLFKLFQLVVLMRLQKISEKTQTDVDDFLIGLIRHIKPPFYFMVSFYLALRYLDLNPLFSRVVFGIFALTLVVQVIFTLQKVIDFVIRKKILSSGEESDKDKEAMVKLAGQLSKLSLWVFGGLLLLSNLGVDITSLVAGLGIGGIAVALAVKDLLGDMFASFSIFVDKPFKVGDFIELGPKEKGTVEKIGIKTTRLQTRQGQELIVANRKLTETTLQNFKRMKKRRVSFKLGVVYGTSTEKLRKIPQIVEQIITKQEVTSFERVHFAKFADSSLVFEVVFVVENPSYQKFADVQQEINFQILERFEEEGIEFAYPTQTLHLKKED